MDWSSCEAGLLDIHYSDMSLVSSKYQSYGAIPSNEGAGPSDLPQPYWRTLHIEIGASEVRGSYFVIFQIAATVLSHSD